MKTLFKVILFLLRIILFLVILFGSSLIVALIYIFIIHCFFDTFSLIGIKGYDVIVVAMITCYIVSCKLEKYKIFDFWSWLLESKDKEKIDVWED